MKRIAPLIFLSPLLLGMSEPVNVPSEVKNLKAKVVDAKGVEHELGELVCGRGGAIRFEKGSLDYTVPLTSIKRLEVLEEDGTSVRVRVVLKGGKEEIFSVPSSTKCTADSEVGSVSFYINEIKSLELFPGEER